MTGFYVGAGRFSTLYQIMPVAIRALLTSMYYRMMSSSQQDLSLLSIPFYIIHTPERLDDGTVPKLSTLASLRLTSTLITKSRILLEKETNTKLVVKNL